MAKLKKAKCALNDGSESRPTNLYIPLWSDGKAISIDVCGASSVDFPKTWSQTVNPKQKEI
jgi:hypothetical protein